LRELLQSSIVFQHFAAKFTEQAPEVLYVRPFQMGDNQTQEGRTRRQARQDFYARY
jgi:hypothetical protein